MVQDEAIVPDDDGVSDLGSDDLQSYGNQYQHTTYLYITWLAHRLPERLTLSCHPFTKGAWKMAGGD
ncbi:hypothetical protein N7456_004031 [Penicillium angulare]|uniref:Uncharacterized protein n=1 Tax=Penicillium angulare TaxID=116970 RepID=A0A9W9KIU1_9EURO|nr:hypothetical protein N7456_004031 [Penicillium angulare]